MQKYKEINGNDYVKDSRTTINETMQSIQSMNSGTAFPTTNLFEGMKCYRTDLKKTYTLTDVENNTWVEDAHATLSDEATHAASATKLDTARSLNLGGAVTADAATFDGTANATINVKTLDATKLNGTASVSTTGNAATATKVVATAAAGASANIAEATMASSDLARIRVSGATNAGELALETADDGSEPIVARQYTGIYTTPVRTAKILDESGNTSFPGTVVAPKFTGALNGNAATATKLQTARTLSLTGKATGSATFDGSADAAINVTSVNADTASKLSTARIINITGDATGAATFDGASDVSINVSVSQAAHADSATTADNSNKLGGYPLNTNGGAGGQYNTVPLVNSAGVMEIGKYIDWHATSGGTEDYSSRWTAETDGSVSVGTINGALNGNSATATKLATPRAISLTGNATGSGTFDGSGDANISVTVNESKHAAAADKATTVNATAPNGGAADLVLGIMANNDYARIRVGGSDDNGWLEIATSDNGNEPIYARQYSGSFLQDGAKSITNEAVLLDGNGNTKFPKNVTAANFVGHLAGNADTATNANHAGNADTATTANTATKVLGMYTGNGGQQGPRFFGIGNAGFLMSNQPVNGHGEYKNWLYMEPYNNVDAGGATAIGVSRQETRAYIMSSNADRNQWDRTAELLSSANYNEYTPTKTGNGASGTWGINITGNADTVDGYHASDIISKIQDITPKTAAAAGQFRELVVNDSHQVKLPDGGTWAYFVYTHNSWSGDNSNGEHRTRMGAGIAAGGTVLHTDGSITSNTINAFHLSGTTVADGADGDTIIVGGFCWRIA